MLIHHSSGSITNLRLEGGRITSLSRISMLRGNAGISNQVRDLEFIAIIIHETRMKLY